MIWNAIIMTILLMKINPNYYLDLKTTKRS